MALNVGNEGNLQRLLDGEHWTQTQVDTVLATLTKAEWEFVQGLWDLYEETKPVWVQVYRDLYGAEPKMVEHRPFKVVTADGKVLRLNGGYAPVIYDARANGKAENNSNEKDAKKTLAAARQVSSVNNSFTKARATAVKDRPLSLSLDGMITGLMDTIHYIHWQPWVLDSNRLIKALDPVMRERYGADAMRSLKAWITDTAAGVQQPKDAVEKTIVAFSRNAGISIMMFNLVNTLQQVTGLTSSMVTLGNGGGTLSGPVWMAKGLSHVMRSPMAAYGEMLDKSGFMMERYHTFIRDLQETTHIIKDASRYEQFRDKYGYWLQGKAQMMVDVPTWWAAYQRAVTEQEGLTVDANGVTDDSRAVALADQAVIDSQGSGLRKDLAQYERSTGAMRLTTIFMSYMNVTLQQNIRIAQSDAPLAKKLVDLTFNNIIPVVLSMVIKAAVVPGEAEGEDESTLVNWAEEQFAFLFGQLVGLREFSRILEAFNGDRLARDYGGPLGFKGVGDFMKMAAQLGQGEADLPLLKSIVSVGGWTWGIPATQINRTLQGISALESGQTDNPAALVMGYQKPH